ncbi:hypothetical protein FACS189450_10030 [Spirochaetia bacterium]|nr:hypothetical protein FACS189450_10030 [Spirochaetia bacterium]
MSDSNNQFSKNVLVVLKDIRAVFIGIIITAVVQSLSGFFSFLQGVFPPLHWIAICNLIALIAGLFSGIIVAASPTAKLKWLVPIYNGITGICGVLYILIFLHIINLFAIGAKTEVAEYVKYTVTILNIMVVAIIYRLAFGKMKTHKGIYAFSSTCFAFQEQTDTYDLVLVLNKNFGDNNAGWWLAPGGHIDLSEGIMPEMVAVHKTKAETGATVKLIKPHAFSPVELDSCNSKVPPQAVYKLTTGKSAKCFLQDQHEFHYDFTYVADVIDHQDSEADKTCIWVRISKTATENEVRIAVENAINHEYTSKGETPIANKYPEDFLLRLVQAFEAYKNYKAGINK